MQKVILGSAAPTGMACFGRTRILTRFLSMACQVFTRPRTAPRTAIARVIASTMDMYSMGPSVRALAAAVRAVATAANCWGLPRYCQYFPYMSVTSTTAVVQLSQCHGRIGRRGDGRAGSLDRPIAGQRRVLVCFAMRRLWLDSGVWGDSNLSVG